MSKSVLFYSNKCKHSSKALEIIKQNNININMVSIDNKNIKLPSFLKVVPTIIEQGSDTPLEGDFVFKWLERFNKSDTSQEKNHLQIEKNEPNSDSIQPFFSNEMSGYSDGYSYLSNENPMNHSYEFINGINGPQDRTVNVPDKVRQIASSHRKKMNLINNTNH